MAGNRILLVENDKGYLEDIVIRLKHVGFECVVYENGLKAAAALADVSFYDLALLNVRIPDGNGFELLDHLNRQGIPVICMIDQNDTYSEIEALNAGAEDCVAKPVDFWILYARMEKALRRNGKLNAIVSIRDITVNVLSRIVGRKGKEIGLRPKEFDLLVVLGMNKNRTLSREELLNEVWDTDYCGDTHTVDAHISSLRKKLGDKDLIKTVHGCGYRLEDKENII